MSYLVANPEDRFSRDEAQTHELDLLLQQWILSDFSSNSDISNFMQT